jgi:HlyD family secretion protein
MIFPRPPMSQRRSNVERNGAPRVWVLRAGKPEAVAVKTGASDGKFTELKSGDIKPGEQVVIDAVSVKQ